MKNIPPYCHDLFDDDTSENEEEEDNSNEVVDEEEQSNDVVEEEEDQSNDVVENETDKIINDDNVVEVEDDDSDCSNDEDKDTSDSEVDNEEDESVEDKDKCDSDVDDEEDDSEVDEDESVINDFTLKNQIVDHYLDNWNKVGTTLSSNKIKHVTKKWKKNHYLNVENLLEFLVNMMKVSFLSINGNKIILLKIYKIIIQHLILQKD